MAFQYKRSITIDYTKVTATLTNFPVLVSVTDADLATVANGGHVENASGHDLCFYADEAGETALKWEVEKYTATTGALVAWVKIPSLSHTANTVIWLFYGDDSISTFQSTVADVWNDTYVGVWHLGDGSTLSGLNSVTGSNCTVSGATAVAGKVAGGYSGADNSNDRVETDITAHNGTRTYSMWTYRRGLGGGGYGRIFDKSTGADEIFNVNPDTDPDTYRYFHKFSTTGGAWTIPLPSATAWHSLAITYDSSNVANDPVGYTDGDSVTVTELTAPVGTAASGTDAYIIGNRTGAARSFYGYIDEFRIANSILSADWIHTAYHNESSPSTFHTLGTEEEINNPPTGFMDVSVGVDTGAELWRVPRKGYTLTPGGNTYYLATGGDDDAAGTIGAPWATFAHAKSHMASGDMLYVRAGTYEEPIWWTISNTIITAYNDEVVIIKQPDGWQASFPHSATIELDDVTGVVLYGLEVRGCRGQTGAPAGDTFGQNCVTLMGGGGFNCKIINCNLHHAQHCGLKEMGHGGQGWVAEGNLIHSNGLGSQDHGIYCPSDNVVLRGNLILENTGWGVHLYSSPSNFTCYNNLVVRNGMGGFLIAGDHGVLAYNVTTENDNAGGWLFRTDCIGNRILNSIDANNTNTQWKMDDGGGVYDDPSDNKIDYSLEFPDTELAPWADPHTWFMMNVSQENMILGDDPLFVDPDGTEVYDFTLQAGSPALAGAGTVSLPGMGNSPADLGLFGATLYDVVNVLQTFTMGTQASSEAQGAMILDVDETLVMAAQASSEAQGTMVLDVDETLVMAGQASATHQGRLTLQGVRQLVMAGQATADAQGTLVMGMGGVPDRLSAGDGIVEEYCPLAANTHKMYTFRSCEGGMQIWCEHHHPVEAILVAQGKTLAWLQRLNELSGNPHWGGI